MNREKFGKVVVVALVLSGVQFHGLRAAFGQTYVTYDIPNADPSFFFGASAIDPAGEVVRWLFRARATTHTASFALQTAV